MSDKRADAATASPSDLTLSEPFRRLLGLAPYPCALTRGPTHLLLAANKAWGAVPGTAGAAAAGAPIGELFDGAATRRLIAVLNRVLLDGIPLRDQFLGPLEMNGRPWSCTVWPLMHDSEAPQGLFIQLAVATHVEATLSLQRQVAERLLVSALRESDAAEGAEALRQRAEFLAATERQLAESLDTETTRKAIAALTLPQLADWCIVDLLEADDSMHRLTIVHVDPRKQRLVDDLQNNWAPRPGDPFGVPAMVRSAQPLLIADNIDAALAEAAHDAANFATLKELGIGPILSVPLIADKRVFGAITFIGGKSGRAFTAADIELAEGLAARSVVALEKARQYGYALALKDKAEAAAQNTTRFLGNISHEIRTPLNAMFGYVDLIAKGIHGPITELQRIDLERIATSQRHLLVLIGELLDFVRVGSGREVYDAVAIPIQDAVKEAVELLEPMIAKHAHNCRVVADTDPILASADPERLHQILVNLISNAIKFTSPGGRITIICKEVHDHVVVEVSDTGRGIAADKLDLIFEAFVQVLDDDARKHGGVGLGLPISRDLARAMNGELTVSSTVGQGSTFTLTLPRSAT